ncbi:MAG TPA: hypothetical protein DCW42_02500 [Bacteroidetes bacterium]|nr:hypothetical protein [Bacteroidota bacterium]
MAEESFVINSSNDNTQENFDTNELQNSENKQINLIENLKPINEQENLSEHSAEPIEDAAIDQNENHSLQESSQPIQNENEIEQPDIEQPDTVAAKDVSEPEIQKIEPADNSVPSVQATDKGTEESTEAHKTHRSPKHQINQEILDKLKEYKETGQTIHAKVEDRVHGGLRLNYEGIPIFLPTSHFSLKDQVTEEDLIRTVGDILEVEILEINDEVSARKRNILASRKNVLEKKFLKDLKIGSIVEGVVSSIASFGIFLDLGGFEGLVHISQISRKHIDDPRSVAKKGDIIKAVVIDVDQAKRKISLSMADLEKNEKTSTNLAEKYPISSIHKATVKRFVDYGAFVELEGGADGLIRNQELSWTQRITNPRDVLQQNQEIQVQVIALNPEKDLITLSYKNTQENPWADIEKNLKIGDIKDAVIKQVRVEGAIVSIDQNIDGFLPKSKMRGYLKNGKIPFKKGDTLQVRIADLVPAQQSLIFELLTNEKEEQSEPRDRDKMQRPNRRTSRPNEERQVAPMLISDSQSSNVGSFSIAELLDEQIKKLFDNNN